SHFDNEYQVHTPFVFSLGLAHSFENLLLAGDVEYADWTQTEFSTDVLGTSFDSYLKDLNTLMKSELQSTANVRAGAEYTFPDGGFTIRAGGRYVPSPYRMDTSDNAQKYLTGGIGFAIERSLLIDFAFAHGWW